MKYVEEPSLQHMANIKIAAALCNQADVKYLLKKSYAPTCRSIFKSNWEEIESTVEKNIEKLPLPKRMKEEILCVIRPVAFEISKWSKFHLRCYNIKVDIPKEFFWTPQGTIDKKKTAEVMVKDQNMDIITRYELACVYCLEDEIQKLWNKITERRRNSFYSEKYPILVNKNELVVFWTYYMKGEMDEIDRMIQKRMDRRCSPYQYAFEMVAKGGNKVATEYFLRKLTPEEREECLVGIAKRVPFGYVTDFNDSNGFMREPFSHILLFLLRELNEEQQIEVFKRSPNTILKCFLDWPLQTYFMETANHMWNFLRKHEFGKLLLHIIGKMKQGYKDFDYQMLFAEFWKQSPDNYKRHVFEKEFDRPIVAELCEIEDKANIELILQDASPRDKKYLLYDNNSQTICKKLVYNNQLSLLKYFIKICLPSKEEVIGFKKNLQNGDMWSVTQYQMSYWQQKFFCVLDDIIHEFKKRKCEADDSSEATRVCTEGYHGAMK